MKRMRKTRGPRGHGRPASIAMLLLVTTSLSVEPVTAQSGEELERAVRYYHEHATSDLVHMQEATSRFEAISVRHPIDMEAPEEADDQAFLAAYWTSFAYTQLGLFADDDRSDHYIRLARVYLERTKAVKPEGDDGIDADVLALEGQVMSFMRRVEPDRNDEYEALARAAWDEAEARDPDNPMVWMSRGLGLIRAQGTRDRAYEILDRAIELYEPRLGSARPNWGREFIDVWMGNYPRGTSGEVGVGSQQGAEGATRGTLDLLEADADSWTVRQDQPGVGDAPRLTRSGAALRIRTGASSILIPPAPRLEGDYRVELVLTQFDPGRRNEGYGLVFGGTALASQEQAYTYFLVRQDGASLLKRRSGSRTPVVRDWAISSALHAWADRSSGSDSVTNRIVMEVDGATVTITVNGREIDRLARPDIATEGHLAIRVNHGIDVRVDRFTAEIG